jgi:hypothetical protein
VLPIRSVPISAESPATAVPSFVSYTPPFLGFKKDSSKITQSNTEPPKAYEYNTLGSKDSFCYCGKKAEDLGSIWDSSAFKFGVFEFDPNAKAQRMKVQVS